MSFMWKISFGYAQKVNEKIQPWGHHVVVLWNMQQAQDRFDVSGEGEKHKQPRGPDNENSSKHTT